MHVYNNRLTSKCWQLLLLGGTLSASQGSNLHGFAFSSGKLNKNSHDVLGVHCMHMYTYMYMIFANYAKIKFADWIVHVKLIKIHSQSVQIGMKAIKCSCFCGPSCSEGG